MERFSSAISRSISVRPFAATLNPCRRSIWNKEVETRIKQPPIRHRPISTHRHHRYEEEASNADHPHLSIFSPRNHPRLQVQRMLGRLGDNGIQEQTRPKEKSRHRNRLRVEAPNKLVTDTEL